MTVSQQKVIIFGVLSHGELFIGCCLRNIEAKVTTHNPTSDKTALVHCSFSAFSALLKGLLLSFCGITSLRLSHVNQSMEVLFSTLYKSKFREGSQQITKLQAIVTSQTPIRVFRPIAYLEEALSPLYVHISNLNLGFCTLSLWQCLLLHLITSL